MVEGTAGNTGIGLAHICNARGYKCIIFMPDTQSQVREGEIMYSVYNDGIGGAIIMLHSFKCCELGK